jgi:hypothetical protein
VEGLGASVAGDVWNSIVQFVLVTYRAFDGVVVGIGGRLIKEGMRGEMCVWAAARGGKGWVGGVKLVLVTYGAFDQVAIGVSSGLNKGGGGRGMM